MSVAIALTPAFRRVVRTFLAHLRLARTGRPRSVHEGRVASRRLREFVPMLEPQSKIDVRSVRRDVRRIARAMGRVRELDVTLDVLATHPLALAWPANVRVRVQREVAAERERRLEAMAARLAEFEARAIGLELHALAREVAPLGRSGVLDARMTTRRRVRARELDDAIDRAGTLYVPADLHAVRIATKKLRYTLEWSRNLAPTVIAAQTAEFKATQQLLGELHDLHMVQAWLRRVAARAGVDRNTGRALQAGIGQLEAACRERHAQFVALMPRLRALAQDLQRKTPLEWIRRRPARMGRHPVSTRSRVGAHGL